MGRHILSVSKAGRPSQHDLALLPRICPSLADSTAYSVSRCTDCRTRLFQERAECRAQGQPRETWRKTVLFLVVLVSAGAEKEEGGMRCSASLHPRSLGPSRPHHPIGLVRSPRDSSVLRRAPASAMRVYRCCSIAGVVRVEISANRDPRVTKTSGRRSARRRS